jgi:hypothetical protein
MVRIEVIDRGHQHASTVHVHDRDDLMSTARLPSNEIYHDDDDDGRS